MGDFAPFLGALAPGAAAACTLCGQGLGSLVGSSNVRPMGRHACRFRNTTSECENVPRWIVG